MRISSQKALARLAVFCLGTSALTLAAPAIGQVIDYPNGTNNASPIVLTNNSTQLQVLTGSATQSGVISESGGSFGLQKIGSGILILTGANTYTGGTIVSSGTLQFGPGGSLASTGALTVGQGTFLLGSGQSATVGTLNGNNPSGVLALNGTLTVNDVTSSTFSGVISGNGSLIFNGPAALTVTGPNTFSGAVTVNGGTLNVLSNLGGGDLTINGGSYAPLHRTLGFGKLSGTGGTLDMNGSFLTFSSSADSTFAGTIVDGGGGQFTKDGTGTLILTGALATRFVVAGGTLQIGDGAAGRPFNGGGITDNATLIFNRSDALTYAGTISGTGSLAQIGTGLTTLTGTNTYSGGTTISAGALNVLGSISASAITVQSGGTLEGLGNVGAVTIQSGARLAPGNPLAAPDSGNSVGTLILNGNLVLDPGATYGAAFGYGPTSGWTFAKAAVAGTASIAGNLSLEFPGYSGIFAHGQQYTLISSSGALSGSFSSVSAPGLSGTGYHIGSVSYDVHDVYLSLVRDIFVWSATPVSSDWSTNSNWQNGAVPQSDVAYFGATNRPTVTIGPFFRSAASLVFEAGAPAYSFTIANPASTPVPPGFIFVPPPPCFGNCLVNAPTEVVNLTSGIVDNSSNPPSFLVGGVFDPSFLNFVSDGNAADASITAAAFGTVTFNGHSDAGPTAKLTTLSGGVFDFSLTSGPNGDNKVSAGSIAGAGNFILGNNNLTVGALNASTEVGGIISGDSGSLVKVGIGTLILNGANTYGGGTTIAGGTLQIGNGDTTGSLTGNIANSGTLAFNRSDTVAFAGTISGGGELKKSGSGVLTLSAANTYTGATTVSAGTLNVTGAIASSGVTVQSGATLSGTGKVGATTIASGGTLTPGSSATPGTLSVAGNLTLASGSNYLDAVTPTAAGLTNVSGAASVNGNFIASLASGVYSVGQRYTVLTASSGVSGTFASLNTSGIPTYVKGRLSYDANNVYLNLDPNALAPSLPNATENQSNVSVIDVAVATGAKPSGGFLALYGLSGPALNSAVDQISGQIGPNVTNAVGQSFLSFLSMTSQGGTGATGNFAPGSAYGAADAPHRAQLGAGEARVWGAAYGGHVGLSADATSGAASLSSSNVGFIGGADTQLADDFLAGATFGAGRQLFSSGNGSGDSNDYMLGLYARANAGAAYVAASLGYGWHQIKTLRVITVSGTDVLQGKQNADDFGGRVEAGWRMALDEAYSVAPYAAFAGESFDSPAYAETAISGASTFALSYAAHTSTLGRSELGAHLDRSYGLQNGVLTADLRAGWAHQLDDQPFTQASFLGLPGSAAFQVAGVRPDRDTALLGVDLQVQNSSGLFFGIRGEGQFGAGITAIEGMGNFGWRW